MIQFKNRPRCETSYRRAREAGLGELAANVVARRVADFSGDMASLVKPALAHLKDPRLLPDAGVAAQRLAVALERGEVIGLVTDYDVDGITAHALIRQALVANFAHPEAQVHSYIGHRLEDGYGLSANVCAQILADGMRPAVVITADCGTSDGPRIARLAAAGIDVIVTDHHGLPDDGVPNGAFATVNPSRDDSDYPDPAIAGCMVAWLLMSLLRQALIDRGRLSANAAKLGDTLDLVALGTVADAVSLFSPSNRAVVLAGLHVLNRRQRPCWNALAELLERTHDAFSVEDLGFQIGPRINARGRMADPFAALNFILAENIEEARRFLNILDADNRDRRAIEKDMLEVAKRCAQNALHEEDQLVCVFDPSFHPGVQGIVASRLLEAFGRVAAVLSPARDAGQVTGSLRSVDGVDVGAALRDVAREHPGLLVRFGGHPKAAGVTLNRDDLERFDAALRAAIRQQLGATRLAPCVYHDGELRPAQIDSASVRDLAALDPYGRGFEPPSFVGEFVLTRLRAVGADAVHLALDLEVGAKRCRAIWFRALAQAGDPCPLEVGDTVRCVYRLVADTYRGGDAVQLIVEHAQPATVLGATITGRRLPRPSGSQ